MHTYTQVVKSIKELVLLSLADYKGLAGKNIQSLGWNFVMVKVGTENTLTPTVELSLPGLSRLVFEQPIFNLRGERSNRLPHRRGYSHCILESNFQNFPQSIIFNSKDSSIYLHIKTTGM